jgi:GTP cyclohydrolase II
MADAAQLCTARTGVHGATIAQCPSPMIARLASADLRTRYGTFHEVLYYDGRKESHALVMGDVADGADVLCRVHSSCIFGHHFNSVECDCREQMAQAQQRIQNAGRGVVIWLEQEGKGNGHYALLQSVVHKRAGLSQGDAYEAVGASRDARDYRAAAAILKDLGVRSIRLLTNNPAKVDTLTRHGVEVSGTEALVVR